MRSVSRQSLTSVLKSYQQKRFLIDRAALVVGSQTDPTTITNPHIRAHALEGRLFRSVVEEILEDHQIRTEILLERDAYRSVAARLKQSSDDLKCTIEKFGGSARAKVALWRSEQKLAALAALFVLG